MKRDEGDPWKGVRVGGLHTKTDKEYQEVERYTRKRTEIVKRGAG